MLLQEFKSMRAMPIMEIEGEVYHIEADEAGLYAGGVTNVGFHAYEGLFILWDDVFSLDEHLQALYELIRETL